MTVDRLPSSKKYEETNGAVDRQPSSKKDEENNGAKE